MVTVIVPVYNAEGTIARLLESLLAQDYPQALTTIVVIDNGSSDHTKEVVARYPVTLLEELGIQSSYAARNRGVQAAKGEVLAFTDADCIAARDWISSGVAALTQNDVDLVAGKTEFLFSPRRTTAELYDAAIFLRTDVSREEFQTSCTCNLFIRAKVFEDVGMFPANVTSMGDYQWTRKATQQGHRLVYVSSAVVYHPARMLFPLLKKCFRTGTGQPYVWLSEGDSLAKVFRVVGQVWRKKHVSGGAARPGDRELGRRQIRRMIVALLCKACSLLGILYAIVSIKFRNPGTVKA